MPHAFLVLLAFDLQPTLLPSWGTLDFGLVNFQLRLLPLPCSTPFLSFKGRGYSQTAGVRPHLPFCFHFNI